MRAALLIAVAGVAAQLVAIQVAAQPAGHGHHGAHQAQPQGAADFKLPDDPRTAIEVPPHVRSFLRYEMRGHLEQLNVLIARIGEGNFKEASAFAKSSLAVMGNHPPGAPSPGAFMPPEFRLMGQAMHKAAAEVARVTDAAATPPSPADWKSANEALAGVTAACAGCHGAFRLK